MLACFSQASGTGVLVYLLNGEVVDTKVAASRQHTDVFTAIEEPKIKTDFIAFEVPKIKTDFTAIEVPKIKSDFTAIEEPKIKSDFSAIEEPKIKTDFTAIEKPKIKTCLSRKTKLSAFCRQMTSLYEIRFNH